MTDAVQNNQRKLIEGAQAYAAFDKSDPFSFSRAMLHIRMGMCRPIGKDGSDAHYTADSYQEARLDKHGVEYFVTCYKNVQRP
jgi:hypothetical protein